METLDSIEKKAIVMTGTSIALATAAALVPGDATTPIANKLADVAGYMVIVSAAIVIEKYLLALMVAPDKKTLKKSVKSMFFMVQTRCEVETIKY